MYQGYRLKINNKIISNDLIKNGSWKLKQSPRIFETYTDMFMVNHVIEIGTSKTEISFEIRPHTSEEREAINALLGNKRNLSCEYYDDNLDKYHSGTFEIPEIQWSHYGLSGNRIIYNATSIVLKEY